VKYALLADIHSNLEALDAVLRDQKVQGCTHLACLGDIVGYGADLAERTVELRRVDYDVAKAQAKLRAAGLPESLADRRKPTRPPLPPSDPNN
jgi:hypothetical protein